MKLPNFNKLIMSGVLFAHQTAGFLDEGRDWGVCYDIVGDIGEEGSWCRDNGCPSTYPETYCADAEPYWECFPGSEDEDFPDLFCAADIGVKISCTNATHTYAFVGFINSNDECDPDVIHEGLGVKFISTTSSGRLAIFGEVDGPLYSRCEVSVDGSPCSCDPDGDHYVIDCSSIEGFDGTASVSLASPTADGAYGELEVAWNALVGLNVLKACAAAEVSG